MKIKALKFILPILPFVVLGGCVAVNLGSCSVDTEIRPPVLARKDAIANVPDNYKRDYYSFNVETFYTELEVEYVTIDNDSSPLNFSAGYTYLVSSVDASWNDNDVTFDSYRFAITSQPVDYILNNFGWSSFRVPWVSVSRVNTSGVRRLYYQTSFEIDALIPFNYMNDSSVVVTRNVVSTAGGGYVSYVIDYANYTGTPNFSVTPIRSLWNSYIDSFVAGVAVSDSYRDGYNDGYTNGNQDGYDDGYADGKADGRTEGYQDAYADATEAVSDDYYQQGYDKGVEDTLDSYEFLPALFSAVVGVPIDVLNGLSGLAVWNMPLIGVLITMVFLSVILWAIRKTLK